MRVSDIEESAELSNGAELLRNSIACEVCFKREEEPEVSTFKLRHEGKEINLCDAHAQEVLDLDDDARWKKGGLEKFLGQFNPSQS